MNNIVKEISDSDLIVMCNEIYEWKHSGTLNQEGLFRKLYTKYAEYENHQKHRTVIIKYLEDELLMEAHNRFRNVVKLLFVSNAGFYVR